MKRFWKEARTEQVEGGWLIRLDGRPVRTPARRLCIVPVAEMADGIAAEWNAQGPRVDPLSMPLTRSASTCLDRVMPEIEAVRRNIASYGGADLLCYRAPCPVELIRRQKEGWDPLLDWAAERFGARLLVGEGVMHIKQPPEAIEQLASHIDTFDAWELTGLSELTTLSGSLIIGLAVLHGHLPPEEGWALSRLDEQWNIEQWGEDAEASQHAAQREADFLAAARQLRLLGHS